MSYDTAQRLSDCKHWRWLNGMRPMRRSGVIWELMPVVDREDPANRERDLTGCVPCMTDPATVGAVLGLVGEVYRDMDAMVSLTDFGSWRCSVMQFRSGKFSRRTFDAQTRSGALLLALEAAP
jgi:hypothetical protein